MTTVNDVLNVIAEKFPYELAGAGDKIGLMVGNGAAKVTKIVLAMDPSDEVIEFAVKNNAELIITHHPIFFENVTHFNDSQETTKRALKFANNNINLISMHTNLDAGVGGLNDLICKKLGVSKDFEFCIGLCKGGNIESTTLRGFIEKVKTAFDCDFVLAVGYDDTPVNRVAVASGAGGSAISSVFGKDIDLFFTGEIKHDDARAARENGMMAVSVGHFATESICKEIYFDLLNNKFSGVEILLATEKPSLVSK